ncbi:MAG: sulfatase-like hydrolase/transferase [Planctomycetes bacterium]|nr:sulfatase-like hydrolase/transferase [Planctomycetota bacterium]
MDAADADRSSASAAWTGARTWAFFGGLESLLFSAGSRLAGDPAEYTPQSASAACASILSYAAVGAVVAALAAPLTRGRARGVEWASVAALSLAVLARVLTTWPLQALALQVAAVIALALVAVSIACWLSERVARQLEFGLAPWSACVWLAVGPWLVGDGLADQTREGKLVGLAIFAVAWLVITRLGADSFRNPRAASVGFVAVVVGGVWASARIEQHVIVAPRPAVAAPTHAPLNCVLITLDTVRADHLSLYGYARDTTPFLRRFAERAWVFDDAIAASDLTLPSHATLLTGLAPRVHGAHPDRRAPSGRPLSPAIETLAEKLAAAGSHAAAVVANRVYLAESFGVSQGFEFYDQRMASMRFPSAPDWSLRGPLWRWLARVRPEADFDLVYRRAEEVNDAAFGLLASARDAKTGFFLFVNYMDAHVPYFPPAPFDELWPGKLPRFSKEDYYALRDAVHRGERSISPEESAHLISQYDGGIAYLDAELERLVAKLEELGLYDDTLIVITADHGEAFGERGLLEHGVSVHQNQVHVPLIVKPPRSSEGRRIARRVGAIDVAPTIAGALGVAVPADWPGRSLLDDAADEREVVAENYPTAWLAARNPRLAEVQRAIYRGAFKLIVHESGTRELFDLSKDPDETSPLDASHSDLVQALDAWLVKSQPRMPDGAGAGAGERATAGLRELGYVE